MNTPGLFLVNLGPATHALLEKAEPPNGKARLPSFPVKNLERLFRAFSTVVAAESDSGRERSARALVTTEGSCRDEPCYKRTVSALFSGIQPRRSFGNTA